MVPFLDYRGSQLFDSGHFGLHVVDVEIEMHTVPSRLFLGHRAENETMESSSEALEAKRIPPSPSRCSSPTTLSRLTWTYAEYLTQ